MRPPEVLETDRLRLRVPTLEDAPEIFLQYAQDPEVTKYLTWRPHQSIETALDRWLGTHFLYIVFLLLGIAAGFVQLIRQVQKDSTNQ